MDEIKPCTGMIWPGDSCPGITLYNIDACRNLHFDVTSYEVKGASHNVCLECIQLAAQHMSPLEHRRISLLRRTICSNHTREDIPSAQHEPCKCLVILDTGWRCWGCRKSTLRGLTDIAMRRRNALDEAHYDDDADNHNSDDDPNGGTDDHGDEGQDGDDDVDGDDGKDDSADDDSTDDESSDSNDSEDRDMKDDRIPRDKAHFCTISGCQEWITSQQQAALNRTDGGMKMCLAYLTILLPSVEDEGE